MIQKMLDMKSLLIHPKCPRQLQHRSIQWLSAKPESHLTLQLWEKYYHQADQLFCKHFQLGNMSFHFKFIKRLCNLDTGMHHWDTSYNSHHGKLPCTYRFNTSGAAPLIFADQFIQLSTFLPSKYLYGLGEHRGSLLHSLDWRRLVTWNRDQAPHVSTNVLKI